MSVIAGRGRYLAGRVSAPARERRNGVDITRVRSTSFGRGSIIGRLSDYASFYLRVLFELLARRGVDGVILLTTPPLLSFLGRIARRVRGQRYAIWSMDLHPDAEIAAGMLRPGSALARVLSWCNDVGYRGADFVIDLGSYMKARIVAKGVPPASTFTVDVWSSREDIEPVPREANPLLDELGLRDRFVAMYSGNAGLVHDFSDILEAMRRMRDDPRIYFLFVGGGPRRREIEQFAAAHDIPNFAYRDYFPRDRLRFSLSVGDVHLISLREPFVGISVPGKLYGIMAAGRPALFVGPARCESADAIRDAGCGAVIDPRAGDAAGEIVAALRALSTNAALVAEQGRRARQAFLDRYERESNCATFRRVIDGHWTTSAEKAGAANAAIASA